MVLEGKNINSSISFFTATAFIILRHKNNESDDCHEGND